MTSSASIPVPPAAANSGAVEFLLRRMQRGKDFPALSETIRTLNGLVASSDKSVETLAATIVRDYALTNKILKVVNSAYYAGFAGKVGTISRAIVVLGIEPIRALAASLMLFEQLSGGSNVERVRGLIGKSMFSALVAREAASEAGLRQGEEAFLAAMFHNLGELLVAFYLPEEDAAILELIAAGELTPGQAEHQVLGVSLQQLGIAIGKHWNFPQAITYSMRRLSKPKLDKPANDEELLSQLACFASDVTDRLAAGLKPGDSIFSQLLNRYRDCVSFEPKRFAEAVSEARSEYRILADGLVQGDQAPESIRALSGLRAAAKEQDAEDTAFADVALPQEIEESPTAEIDPEPVLIEGLQEATTMLAEGAGLNQIAQVILETLFRAFGLRRTALCLRDVQRKEFVGRIGFGADIDTFLKALHFDEAYQRDVFHVALKQKTDVHIADLAVGGAGHGIPSWYGALSPKGALLFLPLVVQDKPIGCIIAEHDRCNGLKIDAGSLRLVRALRNQLALGMQLKRST